MKQKKMIAMLLSGVLLMSSSMAVSAAELSADDVLAVEDSIVEEKAIVMEEVDAYEATKIVGGADMEHATAFGLETEYLGTFADEYQIVWYKFTTGDAETYHNFTLKNLTNAPIYYIVYTDIGEQLVGGTAFKQDKIEWIHRYEANTTYYVRVRNKATNQNVIASGNYTLGVYMLEDPDHETMECASELTEGQTYTRDMCCDADQDWFKFVPQYDGIYSFDLSSLTCNSVQYLVYDEYNEFLGKTGRLGKGNSTNLKISLEKGKTYYILARRYEYNYGIGTYRFAFSNYFPFDDVQMIYGHWKYDAVKYVFDNNIMNGISGTMNFNPDGKLNRAMFATILYRMAGEPKVSYKATFSDVPKGQYYTSAVLWAYNQGIVSGFGDGRYGVNDDITREQIAKMLYLYADTRGYNMNVSGSLDRFTDTDRVNGWATNYVKWAVGAEMISGKPNDDGSFRIDPQGSATRAECAKMISMFMKKYSAK